jgi:putative molybdopterin biosynthesis protein
MGSVDAIAALNAGRCMMAGFHTLDQPGSQSVTARSATATCSSPGCTS